MLDRIKVGRKTANKSRLSNKVVASKNIKASKAAKGCEAKSLDEAVIVFLICLHASVNMSLVEETTLLGMWGDNFVREVGFVFPFHYLDAIKAFDFDK